MFESLSALNLVYAGAVLVSFIFAIVSLVGAEIGDVLDFDADIDGDGDLGFISISPLALAMFGATFGVVGLITHAWLGMNSVPSILWATGMGLLIGILSQALFIYVLAPSRSSHYSLQDDAIGREAQVVLTIPVDGIGEIAFNNVSGRVKLGARAETVSELHTGDMVVIERIVGRVAMVRPADDEKKSLKAF